MIETMSTETRREAMKAAPRDLQAAADALCAFTFDERALTDALANETAEVYTAICAAVSSCRDALAQIEAGALEHVSYEAKYHRDALQSIEALGVPLGA